MEIQLFDRLLYVAALVILASTTYQWRKAALMWRDQARELEAFIKDPNVKAVDKQTEYKDSYEAMVNALSEERRRNHEAMVAVFDVLNELPNNPDRVNLQQIMQAKNVLIYAIQHDTFGRG